jgi:methionine sulfoxide reductase heme-binding subunit
VNPQTWWYMSRASGIIAWLVLGATCLWGILLITRMLKPADRPAWLLDLHRWLGSLAIVTTAVHLLTLVADNYVHFGWKELFVPNGSPWKTGAVSWGVIAFYILVVVQVSSLMMKKMPRRLWHGIHLLSYVLFAMATVHGVAAGTDHTNLVFLLVASGVGSIVLFALTARVLQGRAKRIVKAERTTPTEPAARQRASSRSM